MDFGVPQLHKNRKEQAAVEVIGAYFMHWLEESLSEMNQQEECSTFKVFITVNHFNIYST